MTVSKKTYGTESDYKRDQPIMNSRGFSVLHHDSPFIITWVTNDERAPPIPKRNLTESQFINELARGRNVNII